MSIYGPECTVGDMRVVGGNTSALPPGRLVTLPIISLQSRPCTCHLVGVKLCAPTSGGDIVDISELQDVTGVSRK